MDLEVRFLDGGALRAAPVAVADRQSKFYRRSARFLGGERPSSSFAEAVMLFLVFLEVFANLTPEKLQRLGEECRRHSDETLRLLPGYRIDTNIGDHMFFTGHDSCRPTEWALSCVAQAA